MKINKIAFIVKITTIIISMAILLLNSEITLAQQREEKELVRINENDKRSANLFDDYFKPEISAQIRKQITDKQFEAVQLNCNERTYPACIKNKISLSQENYNTAVAKATIQSLKLYRIAQYKVATSFATYEMSILIAPAKENKNINGDCINSVFTKPNGYKKTGYTYDGKWYDLKCFDNNGNAIT
jgi:hypothetical protein